MPGAKLRNRNRPESGPGSEGPFPSAEVAASCQRLANGLAVRGLLDSEEISGSLGQDAGHCTMENYFVVFILWLLTLVLNLAGVFSFKTY